jgi:hypothetical protein
LAFWIFGRPKSAWEERATTDFLVLTGSVGAGILGADLADFKAIRWQRMRLIDV